MQIIINDKISHHTFGHGWTFANSRRGMFGSCIVQTIKNKLFTPIKNESKNSYHQVFIKTFGFKQHFLITHGLLWYFFSWSSKFLLYFKPWDPSIVSNFSISLFYCDNSHLAKYSSQSLFYVFSTTRLMFIDEGLTIKKSQTKRPCLLCVCV